MIDLSDTIPFPIGPAFTAYYAQPRRNSGRCRHVTAAGDGCLACGVLRREADGAYRRAVSNSMTPQGCPQHTEKKHAFSLDMNRCLAQKEKAPRQRQLSEAKTVPSVEVNR